MSLNDSRSLYSSRKKIFDRYDPKPDQFSREIQPGRKKVKNRQSNRAEDLLEKSLFLLTNIEHFLQMKKKYKNDQKTVEGYLDIQTENLQKLNRNQTEYDSTQFGKSLMEYYQYLRLNRSLLKHLQTFSLANLSNYNPAHTKMQFTRDSQTAERDLLSWIDSLKSKRLSLQESLVIYEYELPESSILGENESFDYCLQDLTVAMREDNIIQVHYLMIYQLKDLQKMVKQQKAIIEEGQQSYVKYEALHDSLELMGSHTIQMQTDQQQLKGTFLGLNIDNAVDRVPKGAESEDILQKNLIIYNSNLQNYVRFGVETDMSIFQDRRHAYTEELKSYDKSFTLWKKAQGKAQYLFERQKKLRTFKQKATIAEKCNISNLQKERILNAYYETLQYEIPRNLPGIKEYKYDLCGQMQKVINKNGVPVSMRKTVFKDRKDDTLRRYIEFFTALEYKPARQKLTYLTDRKDLIEVLKYELSQEEQKGSNYETEKYHFALDYAERIVDCHETVRSKLSGSTGPDLTRFREELDYLRGKRWRGMPIGFQDVLFNFINDLRLYGLANKYYNQLQGSLDDFKQRILAHLKTFEDHKIYVEANQTPYYCIEAISHKDVQSFLRNVVRNISSHNPELRSLIIRNYWLRPQLAIRQVYQKHFDSFRQTNFDTVQKRQFFTFKILCYLILSGKNIKVPNIDQMCLFYLDYTGRHYHQWNSNRKYLQIIKISLFKEFLERVLSKYTSTKIHAEMCQNLYDFSVLMYECELFLESVKEKTEDIGYGLQLYRELFQFKPSFSSTEKINIQDRTGFLIKSIKKLPIVIGTKRIYQNFMELFSKDHIISEFRNNLRQPTQFPSQFLGRVYVANCRLEQLLNSTNSNYQPYENVSVKDRNELIFYLRNTNQEVKNAVSGCSTLSLNIKKIFKDRTDFDPVKGHENRNTELMGELVHKLSTY